MKIYKLLFLITVLLLYSTNNIQATDCRSRGTLLDEFKSSAVVFSGKMVDQEYKRITDTFDTDFGIEVLYVKLKVDRWWKGGSNAEVILRTGAARVQGATRRSGDDFRFTSNENYLVYAGIYKGTLETSNCSRTKTLDKAEEDLKVLGDGFSPKTIINSNLSEQSYNLLLRDLTLCFKKADI